jgi:phytoene/squalene synthetase
MDLAAELSRFGPDAPRVAISPDEARAYCRRLARGHYENFTVVSRLFPRHLQQHLANVYAYCRWADDLADEAHEIVTAGNVSGSSASVPATAMALLDWWQSQLDDMYAGRASAPGVCRAERNR